MKYFYYLIIIILLSNSVNFGQDLQARIQLGYKGTKLHKDFQSVRNVGFGAKVGCIYPISSEFSLEVKPGLFYSMGDYDFSGFELGIYSRYNLFRVINAVLGFNWELSNMRIGDESMYVESKDKLSDITRSFAELYAGFRFGSEKLGLNFGYFFPLIDKIAVHTYEPDMEVTDVFIKGTLEVGLDIKLFTIESLF